LNLKALLFVVCLALATGASSCGKLAASYTLDSNVYGGAACVEVMNPNIILDCAGYSIIGDGTTNSIAVLNNQNGFTIKNCQFARFTYSVFNGASVDYQIVTDNVMDASTHLAVYAKGNHHEITGNYFGSPRGVYSEGLSYSLISDNQMMGGGVSLVIAQ